MKTDITELFDGLSAEEAERLLEGISVPAPDHASVRRTARKAINKTNERKERKGFRLSRRTVFTLAACALITIGLTFGAFAYAAEAKEYRAAKEFFMENGLSTDGLTRTEIKAVYRDITTESFTYDKTAEVIAHNLETNSVPGWELLSGDYTAADIKVIWERMEQKYASEVHFICDWHDNTVTENGVTHVSMKDGSFSKYNGRELEWTYTTTDMRFYFGREVSDGILAVGVVAHDLSYTKFDEITYARRFTPAITKLTNDGEMVWFAAWDSGDYWEEQISDVIEEPDGSLTVFSARRDPEIGEYSLVVSSVDNTGKYLGSVANPLDYDPWIGETVSFDGGYLAVMYTYDENGGAARKVVRIEADGKLANEYSYSSNGNDYLISGIKVFGGKLYISAYIVDIKDIDFNELYRRAQNGDEISDEEYTDIIKNAYTAVLLVTEPEGGEPQVFYEVKGGLCDNRPIEIRDNRLVWTVESIANAHFTPLLNSRVQEWTVTLVEYHFDANGTLVDTVDTGDSSVEWR